MLARLPEGVGQLLVLGDGAGQLALGLEQLLLERPDALGRVLQPPAQGDDLLLEEPRSGPAARAAWRVELLVGLGRGDHLLSVCRREHRLAPLRPTLHRATLRATHIRPTAGAAAFPRGLPWKLSAVR